MVEVMSGDRTPNSTPLERMEELVSLCARRGYIFASSEVYGGINGLVHSAPARFFLGDFSGGGVPFQVRSQVEPRAKACSTNG